MKDNYISQGIKYISSKRGAEISGYTSDYIGQLCRAGKLTCQMVGRTWFVGEESLVSHKENVAREEEGRNRIGNIYAGKRERVALVEDPTVTTIRQAQQERLASMPVYANIIPVFQPVNYEVDARPLLPVIGKTEVTPSAVSTAIPRDDHAITLVQTRAGFLERFNTRIDQVALPSSVTSAVAHKIVSGLVLGMLFVGLLLNYFSLADRTSRYVSARPVTANAYEAFAAVLSLIAGQYDHLASLFAQGRPLTVNAPSGDVQIPAFPEGVVVAPSNGQTADAAQAQKLAATFSDQVNVNPDKSGTAGVITPVFRKGAGDNFLYVLVPVKEKKTNEASN